MRDSPDTPMREVKKMTKKKERRERNGPLTKKIDLPRRL